MCVCYQCVIMCFCVCDCNLNVHIQGLQTFRTHSSFSKFQFPCNKEERFVLNSFFREYNHYFKKL